MSALWAHLDTLTPGELPDSWRAPNGALYTGLRALAQSASGVDVLAGLGWYPVRYDPLPLWAVRYGAPALDPEAGEIVSRVAQSVDEIRMPVGTGIAGHVAETGEVVNLTDAYVHPEFNPELDAIHGYRTTSMLCVPMEDTKGDRIGVVQVMNKKGEPGTEPYFDAQDEALLEAFASQAAIAVDNARHIEAHRRLLESVLETLQTTIPHVFAAGDAVSGPATVVEAVAAAHRAAEGMTAFLHNGAGQGAEVPRKAPQGARPAPVRRGRPRRGSARRAPCRSRARRPPRR